MTRRDRPAVALDGTARTRILIEGCRLPTTAVRAGLGLLGFWLALSTYVVRVGMPTDWDWITTAARDFGPQMYDRHPRIAVGPVGIAVTGVTDAVGGALAGALLSAALLTAAVAAVAVHVDRLGGRPMRVVVLAAALGPVLISAGVMGHLDDALATALLAAGLVVGGSWLLIGLAVAVKPWAVAGLRLPPRDAARAVAVAVVLYLPFLPSLGAVRSTMTRTQSASLWALLGARPPESLRLVELPLVALVGLSVTAWRGPLAGLLVAACLRCILEPGDFVYYAVPLAVAAAGLDAVRFRGGTVLVWLVVAGTVVGSAPLRLSMLVALAVTGLMSMRPRGAVVAPREPELVRG